MKTSIVIKHFPDRKSPMLCVKQGNHCMPVAVLNHYYSEALITNVLGGTGIEVECEKTLNEIITETIFEV